MDFTNELNGFVSYYEQSEIKDRSKLPEGRYEAGVIKCYLCHSQTNGTLQLAWELVIAAGNYAGRHVFRNNRIVGDAEVLGYLKSDLALAGEKLEDIRQLEKVAAKMVGRVLEIYIADNKKNPQYQNVYINKFLRMGEAPQTSAPAAPAVVMPAPVDDGDLPF